MCLLTPEKNNDLHALTSNPKQARALLLAWGLILTMWPLKRTESFVGGYPGYVNDCYSRALSTIPHSAYGRREEAMDFIRNGPIVKIALSSIQPIEAKRCRRDDMVDDIQNGDDIPKRPTDAVRGRGKRNLEEEADAASKSP